MTIPIPVLTKDDMNLLNAYGFLPTMESAPESFPKHVGADCIWVRKEPHHLYFDDNTCTLVQYKAFAYFEGRNGLHDHGGTSTHDTLSKLLESFFYGPVIVQLE